MNKNAAREADSDPTQNIQRPMDADEDARNTHNRGQDEIPDTPPAVRVPDNHREREEQRHVARWKRRAGLSDHRREAERIEWPRVMIKKSESFRDNAARQNRRNRALCK